MSDELERRLRELVRSLIPGELLTDLPLALAREAARLGAELEREELQAALTRIPVTYAVNGRGEPTAEWTLSYRELLLVIRARGAK
jgi:hypothetical protein